MNYELGIKISGKVVHGEHYGRKLGFPTVNLDRRSFSRRKMKIRLGVWAGSAVVQAIGLPSKAGRWPALQRQKKLTAAIVIGPIDNRGLPKIEAHLIGFKGNLYGKKIVLSLEKYIRPFRKFSSADVLKRQIKKDIEEIKKFGNYGN
jgi:riboflavin kinase / FMN adenylyltransferase